MKWGRATPQKKNKNYIITRDFRNLMEFWGLSVDFPHKLQQKWSNWWWFKLFVFVSLFCSSDSSAKKHQGVFNADLVFVPAVCGVSAVSGRMRGLFWEAFDGDQDGRTILWWVWFLAGWIGGLDPTSAQDVGSFPEGLVWDPRFFQHQMSSSWWLLLGGWAERMEMCCSPLFWSFWLRKHWETKVRLAAAISSLPCLSFAGKSLDLIFDHIHLLVMKLFPAGKDTDPMDCLGVEGEKQPCYMDMILEEPSKHRASHFSFE